MNNAKQAVVPAGRIGRLLRLGRMAAGITAGALNQGAKQSGPG